MLVRLDMPVEPDMHQTVAQLVVDGLAELLLIEGEPHYRLTDAGVRYAERIIAEHS